MDFAIERRLFLFYFLNPLTSFPFLCNMPISGHSLTGLQQFHFFVLVFLIPSVGSLRSCSSSDCFSKVMPPRKKRRPAAGDDLSAKKSRHDGYVILPWAKTDGISKVEELIYHVFKY